MNTKEHQHSAPHKRQHKHERKKQCNEKKDKRNKNSKQDNSPFIATQHSHEITATSFVSVVLTFRGMTRLPRLVLRCVVLGQHNAVVAILCFAVTSAMGTVGKRMAMGA